MKSGDENNSSYSDNFINIINRLNEIMGDHITFDKFLEFERDLNFSNEKSERMAYIILKVINKDFKWNLFFKILFDIESGTNADDFESFIDFLVNRLEMEIRRILDRSELSEEMKIRIADEYRECAFRALEQNTDIELMNTCQLRELLESKK